MMSGISLPMVITLAQQLITLVLFVKDRKEVFKYDLEKLQLTLMLMGPLFEAGSIWCSNQKVLKEITEKLEAGNVLVKKCGKIPARSVVRKCYYSRKISKLDAALFRFCQQELMVENYFISRRILDKLNKLNRSMQQSSIAQTPEQLEKISSLAATLQGGKEGSKSHSASGLMSVPLLVAWTRPPNGFLKYNVNGVCHGNPAPAGIGGVCRDANGTFINCFHKGVGFLNVLVAEALAIKEGLFVAADRGHRRIYIESSCEMIINILTKSVASSPGGLSSSISLECPIDISFIIKEILSLQDRFEKVFFCHTLKEGNYVAASLSSAAAILPTPGFWDSQPPNFIAMPLYSDACGVFNLCLV